MRRSAPRILLGLTLASPALAQEAPSSQPASQPAAPSSQPVSPTPDEWEALKRELAETQAKLDALEEAADRVDDLEELVEALSARVAVIDETIAGGLSIPTPGGSVDQDRKTGSTFGSDWTWRVGQSSTSLGGYTSFRYAMPMDEDPTTFSAFSIPRFVLFTHSVLSERASFSMELEIENVGVNTRDTFRFQGEVVLEFAAMDFELTDWLTLRTGVMLVPMGKLNLVHDEPIQDFSERPLVDTFILPSTWFEPGMGVYGDVPLWGDALLRYEAYAVQGMTDRITASGGLRGARSPVASDTNENKSIVGRASIEPFLGLEIGFSGYTGYYDSASKRSIGIAALDLTYRNGPFELVGEAARVMLEPGFNFEGDLVPAGMRGAWLEGHYHVYLDGLKKWKGVRNPHLTLMARYDYIDTDMGADTDDRLRLSGGINFRPIEDYVFKLEAHHDMEGFKERVLDDLVVFSSALSF